MENKKAVTRDQVAKLAKVSTATVSRVYNDSDKVAPEKRRAVLAAAKQLSYTPNKSGSALRRKGSGLIALLELKKHSSYHWSNVPLYSWHYREVVNSVSRVIHGSMYTLSLMTVNSTRELRGLHDKIMFDGIIGYDIESEGEAAEIEKLGVPYVLAFNTRHLDGFNRVYADNRRGGFISGKRLADTGHAKPVYITSGIHKSKVHYDRCSGFCEAFASTDVKIINRPVIGDERKWGFDSTMTLIQDIRRGGVDCIGVVNDLTAVGVVQALIQSGVRIPDDVSVIGHDNLPFILTMPVQIDTVDFLLGRVYTIATEKLLKGLGSPQEICVGVEPVLVPGDSVLDRGKAAASAPPKRSIT